MRNRSLQAVMTVSEIYRLGHSSTRCVFGFKLHLAIDGRGKIVAWRLTNGSKHDISQAENLLHGRAGTAIGDKGYYSKKTPRTSNWH